MADFQAFFSYARDDWGPHMEQFLGDLREAVRVRLGLTREDPIFFRDSDNIELSVLWREEIIQVLQQTKVLLSLQTPRYFISDYCGREVGYFLERQARSAHLDRKSPYIVPIIWWPSRTNAYTRDYQQVQGELPASYSKLGLLVLKQNDKYRQDYLDCVYYFAGKLHDAIREDPPLPPLDPAPLLSDVANVFQEETPKPLANRSNVILMGPRCVRFGYAVAPRGRLQPFKRDCRQYDDEDGKFWKPFSGQPDSIGVIANRVAVQAGFICDLLDLESQMDETERDNRFMQELEGAQRRNNLVVLIVDAWTIKHWDLYRRQMERCDRWASLHCAVLVVWNESDDETDACRNMLADCVDVTFQNLSTKDPVYFRPSVETAATFENSLAETLRMLQQRIVTLGEKKRKLDSLPSRPLPILRVGVARTA